jgi:hypothetical protein
MACAVWCAIAGATDLHAAGPNEQSANQPVLIELTIENRDDLERLTTLVSIDNVRGRRVSAVATEAQLQRLRAAGFRWRPTPHPGIAKALDMCPEGWPTDDGRTWSCYPTYPQYEAFLAHAAASRPEICRLVDLGATANQVRPHRLWALVITDRPTADEPEPEVLLTSTMHGDETGGYVLMLRMIDQLLTGYGSDPAITALVDSTEIWINPNANPDATYFGGDDSVADAIRFATTSEGSSSGIDLNRNFPEPFPASGSADPSVCPSGCRPENLAMMALANAKRFALSVNFHSGAEVVNYPWDSVPRRHPDDAWFEELARNWANLAQADSPPGYLTDQNNGITNGWDWYPIDGGRQDYMTFFHGSREILIELSHTKLLPGNELDDLWQWNREALLDFITRAHHGIRGLVTDLDGDPLSATIEVVGVDRLADGSKARTDPRVGDYHRLLLPGIYDLRITAAGHLPVTVFGVAVIDGAATEVNVTMQRDLVRRPSRRVAPAAD